MQQISRVPSTPTSPSHKIISARTLFSVRPTEPPSSPPPTSPLPALPEIASLHESQTSTKSRHVPGLGPPVRPPRPQISLPELKPRTIKSPEIARRQRSSELAAQVRASPTPQRGQVKSPTCQYRLTTPERRNSIRLLSPTPEPSSAFSDDVLSALPKLFARSPAECLDTPVGSPLARPVSNDHTKAWQVYHRSPSKRQLQSKKPKTETKKPVARSALFIPPKTSPQQDCAYPAYPDPAYRLDDTCYVRQSQHASKTSLFPPRRSSKTAVTTPRSEGSQSPSHKRSQAITSFRFDFGNYYSNNPSAVYGSADDITSLPKIPSTPNLHKIPEIELTSPSDQSVPIYHSEPAPPQTSTSDEAAAFFSVPYAQTLQNAGPKPRTDHDISATSPSESESQPTRNPSRRAAFGSTDLDADPELGKEVRELTEEEKRAAKKKRLIWAVTTITMVLLATAGILAGIISKLTSL